MAENMIVFDSLSYANKLEEVGFTREQAEVQATILTDYMDSTLVSKKDMINSTNDLKRDIEGVRAELKRDIAETHVKIEALRTELKRDIADTHVKIEACRTELKRDIEETHVKIEACRTDLKRDIEKLRMEMSLKIDQLGDRMTIKLGSIMVVGIAAMVAIQKLL